MASDSARIRGRGSGHEVPVTQTRTVPGHVPHTLSGLGPLPSGLNSPETEDDNVLSPRRPTYTGFCRPHTGPSQASCAPAVGSLGCSSWWDRPDRPGVDTAWVPPLPDIGQAPGERVFLPDPQQELLAPTNREPGHSEGARDSQLLPTWFLASPQATLLLLPGRHPIPSHMHGGARPPPWAGSRAPQSDRVLGCRAQPPRRPCPQELLFTHVTTLSILQ